MKLSGLIDALIATGGTLEQVRALVIAAENQAVADQAQAAIAANAEAEARRTKAAEAKRRQRADLKMSSEVYESPQDLNGQRGTEQDGEGLNPPIKESPHTPKKTTPPTSLRSVSTGARSEMFGELWSVLPHRKGDKKQPAEEKFYRLMKASSDPDKLFFDILTGAKSYAASKTGTDPQYISATLVWLNGSGWKDDHTSVDLPPSRASPASLFDRPMSGPRSAMAGIASVIAANEGNH